MHRAPALLLIAAFALTACNEDPPTGPVSSGTITGVAFTVRSGSVFQPEADGPIRGESGAVVVLDLDPAGLGMSDPDKVHLVTGFALPNGASLTISGFGTSADPLGSGASVTITRSGFDFDYQFRLEGAPFAGALFDPQPPSASDVHWISTEFYADSVPGYDSGTSGAAAWNIDDLDPAFGDDVLGCSAGPALQVGVLGGNRIAYELSSAFIVSVEVVDTIIGPCS